MTIQTENVAEFRLLAGSLLQRLICVGVVLHAACATDRVVNGQTQLEDIEHDGLSRHYRLYVPSNHSGDAKLSLVVNIHGLFITAEDEESFTAMNLVAEQEGFLVAFPQAVNNDWFNGEDNIGFIETMIDAIESDYAVDSARVYATGLSQGAQMSYLLGALKPDIFAAIAPVSGTPHRTRNGEPFPLEVPFAPPRPIPMLHIHGTGDTLIPYGGGIRSVSEGAVHFTSDFPPVEEVVGTWLEANGSDEPFVYEPLPNLDPNDGTTVDLFSCSECDTYVGVSGQVHDAEVLLYRINRGAHNWPGDASTIPPWSVAHPVNQDIDGNMEIWNFFSRHELAIAPEPGDFNRDGVVDGDDFLAWQRGVSPRYLSEPALNDWQTNFGTSQFHLAQRTETIPEPSTLTLLATVFISLFLTRFSR